MRTDDPSVWVYFVNTVFAVLLVMIGALLIQCTSRRILPAFCLSIGIPLLMVNMFFILMICDANISRKHPYSYDYTNRTNSIESIELVRLQDYRMKSSEGEGCLEYMVMEALAPEKYEPMMRELTGLQYFGRYESPRLSGKEVVLLIRFSPEQSDVLYAFYGGTCPGKVIRDGKTERLAYDMYICPDNAWDDLMARYFPNAPLQ